MSVIDASHLLVVTGERERDGEGEVGCFFLLLLFYWQGEPIVVLIEEVW